VALGGISTQNIEKTFQLGFDDVALLGSIWNTNQPIQNFKLCPKNRPFVLSIMVLILLEVQEFG
jgi:thiamine-phosphate pyrophosphorylase